MIAETYLEISKMSLIITLIGAMTLVIIGIRFKIAYTFKRYKMMKNSVRFPAKEREGVRVIRNVVLTHDEEQEDYGTMELKGEVNEGTVNLRVRS